MNRQIDTWCFTPSQPRMNVSRIMKGNCAHDLVLNKFLNFDSSQNSRESLQQREKMLGVNGKLIADLSVHVRSIDLCLSHWYVAHIHPHTHILLGMISWLCLSHWSADLNNHYTWQQGEHQSQRLMISPCGNAPCNRRQWTSWPLILGCTWNKTEQTTAVWHKTCVWGVLWSGVIRYCFWIIRM